METSNPQVRQLKQFYEQYSLETIAGLDEIYTQDVEFRDPIHAIRGSLAVKNYLRRMATNLRHYKIRYLDEIVGENTAYLSWEMDYSHPSLGGDRILTLRGMTHVRFTSKVFYHEDCYDMGALLYEHLPVIGTATRFLKQRLARQV